MTPSAAIVLWQGSEYSNFECLSTMLRIILLPQLLGSSPMKSMVMIFPGLLGISIGMSSPISCFWTTLALGQVGHLFM